MKQFILRFVRDEQGQDLVEYTLLLAFVCLASAALFINVGASLGTIWTDANSIANRAALCAASAVS
jgi:Flp pilus assembly pilin Flp